MPRIAVPLTVDDHRRDSAGMRYVYPVLSRRARGVSIGINLNPNNACNWRCVYCQVPDLRRGGPPPLDLGLLAAEFGTFLELLADPLESRKFAIPPGTRIADIAFSGNGEPLSAPEFPEAVAVIDRVLAGRGLHRLMRRVITNGSLVERISARRGLAALGAGQGEAWFKVDAGTAAGHLRINGTRTTPATVLRRLRTCAGLCPTWVQTCMFALDGEPPAEAELASYLALLREAAPAIGGVHLYGIARPSRQAEAPRLAPLPKDWLEELAARVAALGLPVTTNP